MSESLLLDTHVLLWYDTAPDRIPAPVRTRLQDQSIQVFVSAISALEIAIKFRLGKLPQAAAFMKQYDSLMTRYGFRELPLTAAVAISVARLDTPHHDPFDRVLAAQALNLDVPLVTRDPAFSSVPNLRTIW